MDHSPVVRRDLSLAYRLSSVVAFLMAAASLAGLLFSSVAYPSEELRRSFISNDVVNLFIGLPILLGSLWFARRGSLLGLLFWPGALLYTTYNYIAYTVAMLLSWQFVLFLALVLLSVYALYLLLAGLDAAVVQARLKGKVPERFTGGALVVFGILILLLAIGALAPALTGQSQASWAELAARVADLLLVPAWLVCGVLLWRRRALGYLAGVGLLFQASMLFVGLLIFFILQPLVAGVPFPVADFVTVAVMSLICFIPFGLFLRGVAAK
ncbi:MAG: hypothetical protein AB1894_04815 [Chloroflexota bacterium]